MYEGKFSMYEGRGVMWIVRENCSLAESKGTVLGCFHLFAFARPFVVLSAEVQDAMDNHTMQFLFVCLAEEFGIGTNGIERDEYIAVER